MSPVVLIILIIWTLAIAYLRITIVVFTAILPYEQTPMAVPLGTIAQGLFVGGPALLLALVWRNPRYKAIFWSLALASAGTILMSPIYFLSATSAPAQAFFRVTAGLLLCLLIWFTARRLPSPAIRSTRSGGGTLISAALLVAALIWLPWAAFGALGSALDSLLQLASALVVGLGAAWLAAWILIPGLTRPEAGTPSNRFSDLFLGGLVFGTILVVMTSSLGFPYGVLSALLMTYLPALGWVAVSLVMFSESLEGQKAPAWIPAFLLVGLAAAAAMLWIDADELAIGTSLGVGEILQWAFIAASISTVVGLSASLIFTLVYIFRQPGSPRKSWTGAALAAAAAAGWIVAGILYFGFGQPGFYGERLFVILKDQADVSQAAGIQDYNQRRLTVYKALGETAENSQVGLRQSFDRLGLAYTPYYLVNSLEVEGGPLVRLWLTTRPEVDRVLLSPHLRPLPGKTTGMIGTPTKPTEQQWNLEVTGAMRVHSELGINGESILIGQQDSGVQGDHPELAAAYRGFRGEGQPYDNEYNWFDPWNFSLAPNDPMGHGTHTLGSILGKTTGMAPGAQWIGCINLARNLGNPPLYLDCMQFLFAPYSTGSDPLKDGKPELGAMVFNNSWGCPPDEGCDPDSLLLAVRALRAAGVFNAVSAGNEGPACSTLADPLALYDEVYTVGASDSMDNLAYFSSLGPVTADGSGRSKPDILAPGMQVLSSMPGSTYGYESGTSMAGPHVAGAVALLWSANPDLIGDIDGTEQILDETARPYTGSLPDCPGADQTPSTAAGYGQLDVYAAVQRALELP